MVVKFHRALVQILAFGASIGDATAQECKDKSGKFQIKLKNGNTKMRGCWVAKRNPFEQCKKSEMKENCKKSCGQCPGDVKCNIKVDLQYPQKSGFDGYQNNDLSVTQIGLESDVCHAEVGYTSWGCKHKQRDGFVQGNGELITKSAERIRIIQAAGKEYKIAVVHRYSQQEIQYMEDLGENWVDGRPNVMVKTTGQKKKTFKPPKSKNKSTHLDLPQLSSEMTNPKDNDFSGFVNFEHNGDFFVNIACDEECNCAIEKKQPECKLRSYLAYGTENDDDIPNPNVVIRSDHLSMERAGFSDLCSIGNHHASWCDHYGDGLAKMNVDYEWENIQYENIHVPDAAGGNFTLTVTPDMLDDPTSQISAFIYLQINDNSYDTRDIRFETSEGIFETNIQCDLDCVCIAEDFERYYEGEWCRDEEERGDGVCHGWLNYEECNWDDGDCKEFNEEYPGCEAVEVLALGDGICDGYQNTEECKFDGGDCKEFNEEYPGCRVNDVSSLGDGICDGNQNTEACKFDGGDCKEFNEEYPGCKPDYVNVPGLGDGFCHGYQNTEGCKFDGGDCKEFNEEYPGCETFDVPAVGDGICQGDQNTAACKFDGGDCNDFNENYPDCKTSVPEYMSDGYCDDFDHLNTEACGYDGGDCLN